MKFFYFILFGCVVNAQNLVQNYSFEAKTGCPSVTGQLNLANNWVGPTNHIGSPDYFNTCGTWTGIQIPTNNMGYQQPYEGNAYAGIHIYGLGPVVADNYREYLQTHLSSPLVAGENYLISFYVSNGENFRFSCNNMGATLTVQPIVGEGTYLPLNATPVIWSQNIITNSSGWTLISGNYVASGNEQYLTIGNFFDNATTQVTVTNSSTTTSYYTAYYYVDNVSVVQSDLGTDEFEQPKLIVYPNPVQDTFYVALDQTDGITSIELYSQFNKIKNLHKTQSSFYVGDLPSGVYYLTVTYDSGQKVTSKVIKS